MNMADSLNFTQLRGELRRDEPMGPHVSWRAGGRADRFYAPADLADMSVFLRKAKDNEPTIFVGLGSNILVRDGGYRGTVIAMHSAKKSASLEEGQVYAEAGVAAPKVARFA